jgi:Tfp pilus assembly protein PilZ
MLISVVEFDEGITMGPNVTWCKPYGSTTLHLKNAIGQAVSEKGARRSVSSGRE